MREVVVLTSHDVHIVQVSTAVTRSNSSSEHELAIFLSIPLRLYGRAGLNQRSSKDGSGQDIGAEVDCC